MSLPAYSWCGQNRLRISQRAIRGSEGVGILVKSNLLQDYDASTLDSQMERILWLKLTNKLTSQNLCIYVSYFPSSTSSRGGCAEEFLGCLGAHIETLVHYVFAEILMPDVKNLQDISLFYTDPSLQRTGHGIELAWQTVN